MNANRLIRAKILSDMYAKMSDDDKRLLIQLSQDKHDEIMESLGRSEQQLDELSKRIGKHPFVSDLLANVAGNYITEGVSWLFRTIMKKV